MTSSAPAGYYDDGSGRLRYWNGASWTDQYHHQAPSTLAEPKSAGAETKAEQRAVAARAKADRKAAAEAAKAEMKAANDAAKAAKRAQAAEDRAAKEAQKQASLAAFRKRAGNLVKSGTFGGKSIEIYEKGFVRVALFMTANTPLEELRSITYRRNSRDKGAGGRALGAMATGGLNLLASKEKVQAFLSIATDKQVHQLSSAQAMQWEEKAAMALEAAGQAVIDSKRHSELVAPNVNQPALTAASVQQSIPEQVRELATLHSEGILSDEEFASAKARLLS